MVELDSEENIEQEPDSEELDFEWEKVHVIQAPLNEVYRNPERDIQYTGGSSSVKQFYLPFRKVGAGVRQMILKAASIDLNVNVQNLTTHKGFIYHNNTSYSYFNFLNTALTLDIPEDPILKNKKQHNLIGKSIPRIDNLQKTTGKAIYGIDVNIQNMLIASVIQSPYFDGEPIKWNEEFVLKQKGIQQIIKLPNAIAVTGNKFWQVKKALPLLEPEFSKPDNHFPSENTKEIFIGFNTTLSQPVLSRKGSCNKTSQHQFLHLKQNHQDFYKLLLHNHLHERFLLPVCLLE